jgi:hypothetical protein
MSIGWPLVVIIAMVVIGAAAYLSSIVAANASVAAEKEKAKGGEQFKTLAADYEKLAKETRDVQAAMAADLTDMRVKVESIEKMMREVG